MSKRRSELYVLCAVSFGIVCLILMVLSFIGGLLSFMEYATR